LINGLHTGGGLVTVGAGATLGGTGRINSVVGGAGLASPGNSPGIFTLSQTDPTAGLDFAFQFTATGDPLWSNSAASVNDVWRMTHATDPFTAPLTAANVVDVYLDLSIADGDVFRGGFFTDRDLDFYASDIAGATYNFWVLGDGAGTDATFDGQDYYSLLNYDPLLSIGVSTVQVPLADFADDDVSNGWVTQFSVAGPVEVVPEPDSVLLWMLMGLALVYGGIGWRRCRQRTLALARAHARCV
jgi:hypothetical protein